MASAGGIKRGAVSAICGAPRQPVPDGSHSNQRRGPGFGAHRARDPRGDGLAAVLHGDDALRCASRHGVTTAQGIAGISKRRWTPSEAGKALLETIFKADSFPACAVRQQIAAELGVDSRQVQIWFQNRRQRQKRDRAAAGPADISKTGAHPPPACGPLAPATHPYPPCHRAGLAIECARPPCSSRGGEHADDADLSQRELDGSSTPSETGSSDPHACVVRLLNSAHGARALRMAACTLLLNNPILRHPSEPPRQQPHKRAWSPPPCSATDPLWPPQGRPATTSSCSCL